MRLQDIDWQCIENASPPPETLSEFSQGDSYRKYHWVGGKSGHALVWCQDCRAVNVELFIRPDTRELCCPTCLNGFWGRIREEIL